MGREVEERTRIVRRETLNIMKALDKFAKEYTDCLKEIRKCRQGESANSYVKRCLREESMLPDIPIDLYGSTIWKMRYGC